MDDQAKLSRADLESYNGQGAGQQSGGKLRYYCPVHGGDNQRSLAVNPETGRFHCYACGTWGYLEEHRQEWVAERQREEEWRRPQPRRNAPGAKGVLRPTGALPRAAQLAPQPQARPDLAALLPELQQALPGSWGARYLLELRQIPIELAQAHGVGYAAAERWPHLKDGRPVRQWKWGRLTFPHTTPAGEVVNLYGRAVGSNEKVPKADRHDHLPGLKGAFNAPALLADTVFVCEGVMDALSLTAAGCPDACAIFGVDGLRWEWVRARRVVFAMDQDQAGQKWRELAHEGLLRGHEVYFLPPEVYAGHKDLNEAWVATGRLEIGEWVAPEATTGEALSNETIEPPVAWNDLEARMLLAGVGNRIAVAMTGESGPGLLAALEQAEEAVNAAYERQDMTGLRKAAADVDWLVDDGQPPQASGVTVTSQ